MDPVIKTLSPNRVVKNYKVKCIFFDLGGVLLDSPMSEISKLSNRFGNDSKELHVILSTSSAWNDLECGNGDDRVRFLFPMQ